MLSQVLPLALLAAAIPIVGGQTLPDDLPPCVAPALLSSFSSSGCSISEVECICNTPGILDTVRSAIEESCGPEEASQVEEVAAGFCGQELVDSATAENPAPTPEPEETPEEEPVEPTPTEDVGPESTDMLEMSDEPTTAVIPTPTPMPTEDMGYGNGTEVPIQVGGARAVSGLNFAGLAVAIGALTWVFAEL